MYRDSITTVVTSVGETDEMKLHFHWVMLFADNLVHCDETGNRMEERLENWRECLENAGSKVSRSNSTCHQLEIYTMDRDKGV